MLYLVTATEALRFYETHEVPTRIILVKLAMNDVDLFSRLERHSI